MENTDTELMDVVVTECQFSGISGSNLLLFAYFSKKSLCFVKSFLKSVKFKKKKTYFFQN
jgi:hypothetical protein